jgi:hypothetical protein
VACTDLFRRVLSSSLQHVTPQVLAGLVGAGCFLLVLSFLGTSDWIRFKAAQKLADEAAAAGALAAAKALDAVDISAGTAARSIAGATDVTVVAERGSARPGPSGLVFSPGPGDVVRVTLTSTVRSLLGTPVGLGLRAVSSSAIASRSGVASLVERTTAVPLLPAIPSAIEARLFGPAAALTIDERVMLGSRTFTIDRLVAELGRRLGEREGKAASSASVAAAAFKPSEFLAALGALYRDRARTSAEISAMLSVLDRMAAASASTAETPLPFADVVSLSGSDSDLLLAAPLQPIELIKAVMRARLASEEATIELANPVTGISVVRLSFRSEGSAAAALVGGEDSFVGIPGIRVFARFKLPGLSIPGIGDMELPLEVTLGSGDARIRRIACSGDVPEVTVTGRPVRASVRLAESGSSSAPSGATDFVRLVSASGVTAWGKGRSAFADDPPSTLVFHPGGGEDVASLRAPIDLRNRLERLASETQVLVSVEDSARDVMSEGGVRDEISRLIVGAAGPIDAVLSSAFATLGIVPGKMDVVAAGASCNNATLMGEAK